ncbi:hypothetical protein NQ314_014554, partial [Rhamnusium bicolor]
MVLSLDRWVGKVAIVTGASSGIGAAIAEQLVEEGINVAAFARRKELMEELAKKLGDKKGKLYPIKVDLTEEEDILNGFKWVKENLGPVHILINNAGTLGEATLTEGDAEIWKYIFQVNVIGLSTATREAVKDMRVNNVDGHIIHINSVLGHQTPSVPGLNVYPASKFAVTALAETLRVEMGKLHLKIKITNLSPGLVNTDLIPETFRESKEFKEILKDEEIMYPADIADSVLY